MPRALKYIIAFAVVVILVAAAVFVLGYLNDKDELAIPLEQGKVYKYDGEYESKGSNKSIKMTAPQHRIVVERAFSVDDEERYLLVLYNGDIRWHAFIYYQDPTGFYTIQGRDKKIMIFPRFVKRGQTWKMNVGDEIITVKVEGRKKFKTPLGELWARELFFSSPQRTRIRLWINKTVGIVAIDYSYLGGSNRNEAHLVLSGIGELKEVP